MATGAKQRGLSSRTAKSGTEADNHQPLPLHSGARLTARVSLAIVLLGAALWTAADFLPALIWAVILAITIWPLYVLVADKLSGGPSSLSAFLMTLLVGLTLFLPLGLAAYQVAQQNEGLVNRVTQARENGIKVPEWVPRLPVAADAVGNWWAENLANPQAASAWLQSLNTDKAADMTKTFGGQLLHRAFMFLF